jgi:hypothetical protein
VSHGTGQHEWLGSVPQEVEHERDLLERVGAGGDHDAARAVVDFAAQLRCEGHQRVGVELSGGHCGRGDELGPGKVGRGPGGRVQHGAHVRGVGCGADSTVGMRDARDGPPERRDDDSPTDHGHRPSEAGASGTVRALIPLSSPPVSARCANHRTSVARRPRTPSSVAYTASQPASRTADIDLPVAARAHSNCPFMGATPDWPRPDKACCLNNDDSDERSPALRWPRRDP